MTAPIKKRIQKNSVTSSYWDRYGKELNIKRRKPKHSKICKGCGREFETARDNQVFHTTKCKESWWYKQRGFKDNNRIIAMKRVQDKGKKRVGGYEYTADEIKYIIKKYPKQNAIEIAKYLDRPVAGVRWKIRCLKEELAILPSDVF
jgi:hypothetical protein